MKSTDFPGKQRSPAMMGLRTPEAIPEPSEGLLPRASARATMLQQARLAESAQDDPNQSFGAKPLEGEWLSGESILDDIPATNIVVSPYQPRLVFDEAALDELASSIQAIGLGKPILVRPLSNGMFELVGGERRWRAVQLLAVPTIQAIIKKMSDGVAMLLALTDNTQEDLSDYELARSYDRILKNGEEQSQRALARRLGVNVSTVSRCLLLMQLPEAIREVLNRNPRLITANYAKKFVDYSEAHSAIVEKVVQLMDEGGLQQEAAIRLIEKEIATLNKAPHSAKDAGRAIEGVGTMKVTGMRVEFKCEKGIDPQRLSQQLEEFLRTLDLRAISSETVVAN